MQFLNFCQAGTDTSSSQAIRKKKDDKKKERRSLFARLFASKKTHPTAEPNYGTVFILYFS